MKKNLKNQKNGTLQVLDSEIKEKLIDLSLDKK